MQIFCFPLFYFLPGNDGGHFENEIDTIVMLGSSQPLLTMFVIYTCSCAVYNMAGIAVTADLTAVHRVMLEALRTLIVWAFDLYIHYYVDATSAYGEFLTPWSSLEIIGFVFIVLGQAIYGGMLKVPGMKYRPNRRSQCQCSAPLAPFGTWALCNHRPRHSIILRCYPEHPGTTEKFQLSTVRVACMGSGARGLGAFFRSTMHLGTEDKFTQVAQILTIISHFA